MTKHRRTFNTLGRVPNKRYRGRRQGTITYDQKALGYNFELLRRQDLILQVRKLISLVDDHCQDISAASSQAALHFCFCRGLTGDAHSGRYRHEYHCRPWLCMDSPTKMKFDIFIGLPQSCCLFGNTVIPVPLLYHSPIPIT